jgi:hypothetical protein
MTKPPPLAGGDHHREMAGKLRELARYTRSPGIHREVEMKARIDALEIELAAVREREAAAVEVLGVISASAE